MSEALIVAVDAGTSVIKAVAFDAEGRIVAATGELNRYRNLPGGGVEQDMDRTWADAAAALAALAERVPDLARRAAALAVTGQGDGTWLVDRAGEPVAPAWLWLDSRAAGIVEEFDRSGVRRAIFRHTGSGLNACNQSSQLVWLDRHAPAVLDKAATGQHCKDWLYFKLTGERVTDPSEGAFTFGNFRSRCYEDEILDRLGLGHRRHLLPEMVDGSRTTHPLSAAAARAIGLPQGLPVSLGYVDVVCTALGAGLYEPGRALGCSIVGSTGMHMRFVADGKHLNLPEEPGGYTMTLPIPGAVSQMQSNMAATLNIDWIVDAGREAAALLGRSVDRKTALAVFDAEVLKAPAAAALFHPYIQEAGERGPFVNVQARAQFTGLSSRVGFAGLLRAVYEGLALAALDCYRAVGHAPEEVRIAGGAARSPALRQILASVLGVPVRESSRDEAGAAGAAMIASVAIGASADFAAATARWVAPTLGEPVRPDPAQHELYQRLYPIYVESRRLSPPLWAALAEVRAGSMA
jgi:erythritol kinase (D-erythritol 1-phosphate-forming)